MRACMFLEDVHTCSKEYDEKLQIHIFCGLIIFDHVCLRTYEDYDDVQDLLDDKNDVERI